MVCLMALEASTSFLIHAPSVEMVYFGGWYRWGSYFLAADLFSGSWDHMGSMGKKCDKFRKGDGVWVVSVCGSVGTCGVLYRHVFY